YPVKSRMYMYAESSKTTRHINPIKGYATALTHRDLRRVPRSAATASLTSVLRISVRRILSPGDHYDSPVERLRGIVEDEGMLNPRTNPAASFRAAMMGKTAGEFQSFRLRSDPHGRPRDERIAEVGEDHDEHRDRGKDLHG